MEEASPEINAIAAEYLKKKTFTLNALHCNDPKICPDIGLKEIPQNSTNQDEQTFELITVLDLEKFRKMHDVPGQSKEFQEKLSLAMAAYPYVLARNHDIFYLTALARGSRIPNNPAEERAANILKNSLDKRKQVVQEWVKKQS